MEFPRNNLKKVFNQKWSGWTPYMSFLVFDKHVEDTKRIAVGAVATDKRVMLNHPSKPQSYWDNPKHKMNYDGWKHVGDFYSLDKKLKGTKHITVGQVPRGYKGYGPHRAFLFQDDKSATRNVYEQYLDFYAYPDDLEISGIKYHTDKLKTSGRAEDVSPFSKGGMLVNKSDKNLSKKMSVYIP